MQPLTVIVVTVNAVGHVNACAGALSVLRARGHRVVFVVEQAFRGKLTKLGYEEFVFTTTSCSSSSSEAKPELPATANAQRKPGERMAQVLVRHRILGDWTPLEKMTSMVRWMDSAENRTDYRVHNAAIERAIECCRPDLIYVDGFFFPAVHYSGVPWVCSFSVTPLFANELLLADRTTLPPSGSGLPSEDSSLWGEWDQVRNLHFDGARLNSLLTELGYPPLEQPTRASIETQSMTVYAYPNELNYDRIRQQSEWFNLEVFNPPTTPSERLDLDAVVPEHFLNDNFGGHFSGKLIYLSLGSMGAVDLDLMTKLISVLSTTPHKYIVSKGLRTKEFELPPNMWGDCYLPQASIVPHVDLVITHGGNNTVTEVFAEGKPMLVLPILGDQFDNAQRLTETGFGARIDTYNFTERELVRAVDRLLHDEQLQHRLRLAARRLQTQSDKRHELATKIEKLVVR